MINMPGREMINMTSRAMGSRYQKFGAAAVELCGGAIVTEPLPAAGCGARSEPGIFQSCTPYRPAATS